MSVAATSEYSFDDHCRLLGRLCITWSALDRLITDNLSVLIGQGPMVTACIVSGVDSIPARIEAIRNLAVHHCLDEKWRGRYFHLMSVIADELSATRNRYVHDWWHLDESGDLHRLYDRAKRLKAQSRKPLGVQYSQWHIVKPSEVQAFGFRVEMALLVLRVAVSDLVAWRNTGQFPNEPYLLKMGGQNGLLVKQV